MGIVSVSIVALIEKVLEPLSDNSQFRSIGFYCQI